MQCIGGRGQHVSTAYEILPDGGRLLATPSGVVAWGGGGGDSMGCGANSYT